MFSFLIELCSIEKSCTSPFTKTSLCSSFVKSKKNLYQKFQKKFIPKKTKIIPICIILRFKFANLCFIYIQVTLITIVL